MQLDAFLASAEEFAQPYDCVSVLYRATGPRYAHAYDELQSGYPSVEWVRETDFRSDLTNLIDEDDLTVFHTDDDVFFAPFPAPTLREDEVCLSLRLGRNTTYCYPLDAPEAVLDPEARDGRIRWEWRKQGKGSFSYPLSVNGHVFRGGDARRWIAQVEFSNPNELEAALQSIDGPLPPMMASYEHSSVVSIPLNVVNDAYANRAEWTHGAEELNARFLRGQRFDRSRMDFSAVEATHQAILPVFACEEPDLEPLFEAWAAERASWNERLATKEQELREVQAARDWLSGQRDAWEQTARDNSNAVLELQEQLRARD